MNTAIKDFAKSIISILTGALSGNIPLIGAAAISLLGQFIEQAQNLVDGHGELTEEEKTKLKAVLAGIQLKTVDEYLQAQGTTRAAVEEFIAQMKSE